MRIITRVSKQFERARRREIEGRADLAQIGHRGVGIFRTGGAEAGDQALRVIEIMVADPGERQIGERDVVLGQLVEGHGIGRRLDRALAGEHDALGCAGGAGGVEDDGGIGAFAGGDLGIEPGGDLRIGERLAPLRDDIVHRMQVGVVVVAQAAPSRRRPSPRSFGRRSITDMILSTCS